MMEFLAKYSYLTLSLGLLILFVTLYIFSPRSQRKLMLISALLSSPFGFASVIFVPEYWNPVRIAEFGAGLEDLIFSFANGGTIWILSTILIRRSLDIDLNLVKVLRRYALFCALGTVTTAVFMVMGVKPMTAVLVTITVVGLLLTVLRPNLGRIILPGMLSFSILYTAYMCLIFILFPDCIHQWSMSNLSGVTFLGVPLEETVWAAGFGAVWPLFMAYVFDAKTSADPVLVKSVNVDRISGARQMLD